MPSQKISRNKIVHGGKIINRRWISQKTFEIQISRSATFHFEPGLAIKIIFEGVEGFCAPVSAPDDPTLVLHLQHIKKEHLSNKLALCEMEAPIQFTGPFGYFTFRNSSRPAVFVAFGTGIAPFVSMVRSGVKDFILIQAVSTIADLTYEELFRKSARKYIPCVSRGAISHVKRGDMFLGKVTDYLTKHLLPGTYDFYLSGKREAIRDVVWLIDDRFPGSNVYTEIFCDY
jgi:benzoate/toluate 1,2-dioxygenase reductase component